MVALTSYGLTGLTAMLVVAFCFACGDAVPSTQEKSSHNLINGAHMSDSPMIETGARSPRLPMEVDKQQETALAPLQRKTSAVETGHGAIYNYSCRNDRGPLEAFHG